MAIGTPVYTPKLPYLFAMMIAVGILFLDQKYDYFAPIKNTKTYLFAETKDLTNKLLISSNNFFDGFSKNEISPIPFFGLSFLPNFFQTAHDDIFPYFLAVSYTHLRAHET